MATQEQVEMARGLIQSVEEKLPKWRLWFPHEESEVEVRRNRLLALVAVAKQALQATDALRALYEALAGFDFDEECRDVTKALRRAEDVLAKHGGEDKQALPIEPAAASPDITPEWLEQVGVGVSG